MNGLPVILYSTFPVCTAYLLCRLPVEFLQIDVMYCIVSQWVQHVTVCACVPVRARGPTKCTGTVCVHIF